MSKGLYTGISDKARKNKKFYLGISEKARNVVKGYVGVDDKARQFWPAIPSYEVRLYVSPSGTGTVSGAGTYEGNTSVSVRATPYSDYKFREWRKSGSIVSTNSRYTFNISEDTSLTAYFEDAITPLGNWNLTSLSSGAKCGPIAYCGDRFVVASYYAGLVSISTNGISWSNYDIGLGGGSATDIAYGNGTIVISIIGKKFYYSKDKGITWSSTEDMPISSSVQQWKIAYGNSKFVAISAGEGKSNLAAYSSNGVNWTPVTLPYSNAWGGITYGNGKFLAVGDSGKFVYSTDGENWTVANFPNNYNYEAVAYGDGKFVATTSTITGTSAYSEDGVTWKSGEAPNANLSQLTYGGGKFLGVYSTYSGGISNCKYTSDAKSWVNSTLPESSTWVDVAYGGGKFVMISYDGDVAYATG